MVTMVMAGRGKEGEIVDGRAVGGRFIGLGLNGVG